MAENGNGHAPDPRFLPDLVWQELRALLDPGGHFYGEFTLVIHDGRLVHTERVSRMRRPVEAAKSG